MWNRFPITYSLENIVMEFDVKIVPKDLTSKFLSDTKNFRLDLIDKLHKMDCLTRKYLNL